MRKPLSFIYFDLGGVLYHYKNGIKQLSYKHNLNEKVLYDLIHARNPDLFLGKISLDDIWRDYQAITNIKKKLNLSQEWAKTYRPVAGMARFVEKLAAEYPVGILANCYKGTFENLIKLQLLPQVHFTSIVNSCEVGLAKPDPKIFQYAQASLAIDPHTILFIDDKEANITAAKKLAGWQFYSRKIILENLYRRYEIFLRGKE